MSILEVFKYSRIILGVRVVVIGTCQQCLSPIPRRGLVGRLSHRRRKGPVAQSSTIIKYKRSPWVWIGWSCRKPMYTESILQIQIQIYKYKYTNTNTNKDTNTDTDTNMKMSPWVWGCWPCPPWKSTLGNWPDLSCSAGNAHFHLLWAINLK